jgi:hypothetical protein
MCIEKREHLQLSDSRPGLPEQNHREYQYYIGASHLFSKEYRKFRPTLQKVVNPGGAKGG